MNVASGHGHDKRRFAREAIDLAAWSEGRETDPADRAAMAAHGFAAGINRSTQEATLPFGGSVFAPGSTEWRQSADAVIDRILERGRSK